MKPGNRHETRARCQILRRDVEALRDECGVELILNQAPAWALFAL